MWGDPVRKASQEPAAYRLPWVLDILPIFCPHTPSQINGSLAARTFLLTDGIWWMIAPIFSVVCFLLVTFPPWKNKNSKHPYDLKKYIGRIWKNSPHLLLSLLMMRVISWKATPFGNKPYKPSQKKNLLGYIAKFYFTNYNPWFLMVKHNNFLTKNSPPEYLDSGTLPACR